MKRMPKVSLDIPTGLSPQALTKWLTKALYHYAGDAAYYERELKRCDEQRLAYDKQAADLREEVISLRAVVRSLQSFFRPSETQPDVQRFVVDYIEKLQQAQRHDREMEQLRTDMRAQEREHAAFKTRIQAQFKEQIMNAQERLKEDFQRQLDGFIAQEAQVRAEANQEIADWKMYAEALRNSLRAAHREHNNLVLQYEALRTRRTLRDITNAPDDSQDENSVVWMEMDAQLIEGEAVVAAGKDGDD